MSESINVGDEVRISYTLIDYLDAAWQPTGSGRIVFRVWEVGLTYEEAPSYEKTWLAAGGGDAAVVRDGAGLFHMVYGPCTTANQGLNLVEIQAYSDTVSEANSRERTRTYFIAK